MLMRNGRLLAVNACLAVVCLLTLGVIAVGCSGSRSSDGFNSGNNNSGPLITDVDYIDVDSNGVDVGDVIVMTFDQSVRLLSSTANAFRFARSDDSFGTAPLQTQTVPGSNSIEILLGTAPLFVAGASSVNIKNAGILNIVDQSGDDASLFLVGAGE